ncbi:MAG: hypothetical protein WBC02_10040 [Candidatus Aminicenantaceae bacterium]
MKKEKGKKDLEYKVNPVFMNDLRKLFSHLHEGVVDISDKNPPVNEDYIKKECIQYEI